MADGTALLILVVYLFCHVPVTISMFLSGTDGFTVSVRKTWEVTVVPTSWDKEGTHLRQLCCYGSTLSHFTEKVNSARLRYFKNQKAGERRSFF